jgi:hypothetical protein
MKLLFRKNLFLYFIFFTNFLYSQNDIGINYYQADSILNIILNKYDLEYKSFYKIEYKGTEYISGHFKNPEAVETCDLLGISSYDDNCNFSLEFNVSYKKQNYYSQIKWLDAYCLFLDYNEKDYKNDTFDKHIIPYYYSIHNLLHSIIKNKTSVHYINLYTNNKSIIGFNDEYGNKIYVYIDNINNYIEKIDHYYYDNILGDCKESIEYFTEIDKIKYITHLKNDNIFRILNINNKTIINHNIEDHNTSISFQLDTISSNIYLISLLDLNNKTLISVNNDYISVFEAPVNPMVSKELIQFIEKKFERPIKYCYLSHHHPDHAGGVKSFGELNDCIIVTPKNTFNYISNLIYANHTFNKHKVSDKTRSIKSILIEDSQIANLGDKSDPVIAYEIGKTTNHTDNFIIYHLPKQNVLFTSDLVLFSKDKVINQKERALSIYTLIRENKINTKDLKLISSWPLHGFKKIGTYPELLQSLIFYYPNIK